MTDPLTEPVRPEDFYGTYVVRHVSFDEVWNSSLRVGDVLTISASTEPGERIGAEVELLTDSGEVKFGPAFVPLVNACLAIRYQDSTRPDGLLTTVQISRVAGDAPGGGYSVYGSVAAGDPQQVGVWGAEDDGGG